MLKFRHHQLHVESLFDLPDGSFKPYIIGVGAITLVRNRETLLLEPSQYLVELALRLPKTSVHLLGREPAAVVGRMRVIDLAHQVVELLLVAHRKFYFKRNHPVRRRLESCAQVAQVDTFRTIMLQTYQRLAAGAGGALHPATA